MFSNQNILAKQVVQLAGYVSEHSSYHHGEASLTETIVKLAQNYVGMQAL
jgi:DNA topoisomerase-2